MQFTTSRITHSLIFFLMVVGFVGCKQRLVVESNRSLNVAVAVEISSLDPQTTSSIEAIKIQSALFETLVKVDADTGEIVPAGALSWEISSDGCVYSFELDPERRWSDGHPLTAGDYEFSMRRLLNPELGAAFASLYSGIEGAEAVLEGRTLQENIGVRAPSDTTLEIRLRQPIPYFLSLLARPCVAALPEHYLLKKNAETSRITGWSLQPGFPASGPYVLKEWLVNKQILLVKNPTYPGGGDLDFEAIHFYPIESAYAQERGFLSGALDITSKLASERIASFRNDPALISQAEMGTFYVITNTESSVLNTADVRHALSASIDREVIVDKLRQRGERPATRFSPPLWHDYHPKVERGALSERDRVAWPEGVGRTLKFLVSSSEGNLQIAEALQAMWTDELGIEVEIVRQEWKSYLDSRNRGNFDLCLATWIGDYFDPLTFLEMWKSDAPNNFSRWKNDDYDRWLLESATEFDPDTRFRLLEQAEQRLLEAAPILPVFYLSRVYLKSENIDTWPQTILNTVDYTQVKVKAPSK